MRKIIVKKIGREKFIQKKTKIKTSPRDFTKESSYAKIISLLFFFTPFSILYYSFSHREDAKGPFK